MMPARSFKRLPNELFAVLGPLALGEILVDSDQPQAVVSESSATKRRTAQLPGRLVSTNKEHQKRRRRAR